MKKLLFILLLAIAFVGCNNGEDHPDLIGNGCYTYHWRELSQDQKDAAIANGYDSLKQFTVHFNDSLCYTILP